MTVLIEPSAKGYRASTGAPLSLEAEAQTADAAMEAVRELFAQKLRAEAELRVLTTEQAQEIQNTVEYLKAHPLSAEYEQAIEEYRLQHNAKPYPEA